MTQPLTILSAAIILSVMSCAKQDKGVEQPVTVELQSTIPNGSITCKCANITLSLGTDASKTVTWSSKPDTGLTISGSGNTASVHFKSSGTYKITGVLGNATGSSTFTVRDSVAVPGSSQDLAYKANEELLFTVSKLGDTVANGGIQIGGYTSQSYPCGTWARSTQSVSNNTLTIHLKGLLEPLQPCSTGPNLVYAGGGTITNMAAGSTYQLVIHFMGQVYTGSINKSASGKFTITWPYTNGIKITPLSF
jgi:hypothetical protein